MLEILIGPIASGKSSYCEKKAFEGAIIVNDDSIVNSLHANINTLYNPRLKSLYKSIENHIIIMGLELVDHVIIDRPNNKRNTRIRYTQLARSLDHFVKYTVFNDCGMEEHVHRRMEADSRGYLKRHWEEAYLRQKREFDEILPNEWDDIEYLC